METLCDKCGNETDITEMMPDPSGDGGNLCFECHLEAEYVFNLKKGRDFLASVLPTMEKFMEIYERVMEVDPVSTRHLLAGNCHPAALMLVRETRRIRGMEIVLKRGHWLGEEVRPERAHYPGQQHSWTEVKIEGNPIIFIVDPTQFVFTGDAPHITITTEDDRRYDPGSFKFREMIYGWRKKLELPPRTAKGSESGLCKSGLGKLERECLTTLFDDRDWRHWTMDELFVIANRNPELFGTQAKHIYQAIINCGQVALIPIDARREILQEDNESKF
jgi:hypothetical protein